MVSTEVQCKCVVVIVFRLLLINNFILIRFWVWCKIITFMGIFNFREGNKNSQFLTYPVFTQELLTPSG